MREELQNKIDNLSDKQLENLLKLWDKINLPNLTTLESRELQYLIKQNQENNSKQRNFGTLKTYKEDNNIWLKVYLHNLLNKLRKHTPNKLVS